MFIVFDIESVYPSISLELFNNRAMTFVSTITRIADDYIKNTMQSKKTCSTKAGPG